MTSFIETLNHWGDHFLNFAWPVLWQSSLLIAVIFVLEFALRRKIRAAIRYALWLVVLVKLLLPPSFALPTSPTWWIHPAVPPPAKAPPVSFTVSYGEQMAPSFPLPPPPVTPPLRAPAMSFAAWAVTAAGVVSAGLLAWLLVRWRQINQKARRATASEKLIPILNETRRLTHLRLGIRLKLTGDSMSPAVCGLFRPVILLPQSLVEKLSAGQLRAVLLHEAIHLRRGDVWVNCAQALLQIVYWWHPLLWLANARIRRVREEAVDDAVMLALRDDADIYAPTLLEVAKLAFNRPLASLGLVGILESRSALRQRIERLLNINAPKKAGLTVASILGILAFSAVALPMGEAPEKTNAPTVSVSNLTIDTNAPGKVFKAGTGAKTVTGLLSDTNFRAVLHALEQRTGTGTLAEPEAVSTAGREVQHMRTDYILQQPQYTAVTNNGLHTSPGREMINRKLNSLRLESVSWSNGLPLNEVMRYLVEQSRLRDPDRKGINFMFNPNVATGAAAGASNLINPATGLPETPATNAVPETVDVSAINVKLMLNNASLHEVLDAVVRGADRPIRYTVEEYGVIISAKPPGPEPPILEMRVFKVDTNTFLTGITNVSTVNGIPFPKFSNRQTNSVQSIVKEFFAWIGVDLTAPGRNIAFNDKLGLLFVRATPPELDTIERVIQALNQRTRVESLAEPEPVTPAEQGADRINRMFVPDRIDIPTTTTNALESGTLVQEGKSLYEMGKFDDAEAKFKAALALYPTNPAAQYYLNLVEQARQTTKAQEPKINYPSLNSSPTNSNPHATNLETRVFKVDPLRFSNSAPPDTLGVEDLSKKLGVDLTAPGRNIALNDKLGLLMVKATPSELDTIERIVQTMNQVAPQIHIKTRFIELDQDNNAARGFDWYLGSFTNGPVGSNGRGALSPTTARTRISNTTVNAVAVPASDQSLTQGLRNTVPAPATVAGILSDPSFRVTLHALEHRPGVETLAEPECVTTSGRRTQMHATEVRTFLNGINPLALKPPGVSSNELFLTEQVECGPVFDVVPSVLADGYTISLRTTASVTEFLGYDKPTNSVTVYINGKKQTVQVPLPKFRTQKISTVVNLWDNQTLVLGGPVTSAVQTTKHKVPLLGDLPLLGGLFRSQTENSVKKQLMVFVTATIVDPAGNRAHSDDGLPFKPSTVPPQPQISSPSR
jgi:beta-lactamase regulating signal transducer with metallopeptidase domain/type II secretory pathway component GspD/PulD (secretin)